MNLEILLISYSITEVAIADTGTSLLGAPRAVTQRMHWLLARKVERGAGRTWDIFILDHSEVHPWKLTCPLKWDYVSREYIFQPFIFTGHVSFQGSNPCFLRTSWICMCFAKGKRDHVFSFLRETYLQICFMYRISFYFCYQRFLFWEARQHYLKKTFLLVWQRALTTSALCKELTTVYWCYNMHTGTFCFCKSPNLQIFYPPVGRFVNNAFFFLSLWWFWNCWVSTSPNHHLFRKKRCSFQVGQAGGLADKPHLSRQLGIRGLQLMWSVIHVGFTELQALDQKFLKPMWKLLWIVSLNILWGSPISTTGKLMWNMNVGYIYIFFLRVHTRGFFFSIQHTHTHIPPIYNLEDYHRTRKWWFGSDDFPLQRGVFSGEAC